MGEVSFRSAHSHRQGNTAATYVGGEKEFATLVGFGTLSPCEYRAAIGPI
jgi:hypothetical protein